MRGEAGATHKPRLVLVLAMLRREYKTFEVRGMEYENLVRSAHGVAQNTYHLIWVTKYRYKTFASEGMRTVVLNALSVASTKYGIELFEAQVMQDHVHVFARLPRTMSVAKAFQLLKGYTSYHIRKYQPFRKRYKALWSPFQFSRTVGSVTGGVIQHYIKESNTRGRYGEQRSLYEY